MFYRSVSNPDSFAGVPRIFNSIYTQYKMLLDKKVKLLNNPDQLEIEKLENEVKKQFSSLLGNRIQVITIGGAPSSSQVRAFLTDTFNCYIFDSYGTTESGGISSNGSKDSSVEMILIDVPELGYTTQDKPFPRGEIAVRTKSQGLGYYREPELTAKTWTPEGFVRTGDIAVLEADNHFRIITRIKNVSKLAQGEYVDPDKLQNIFIQLPTIDQIYIDVNGLQESLAAIIVPIFPILFKQFNITDIQLNDYDKIQEFCERDDIKSFLLHQLDEFAKKNHLLSYEHIRGIYITPIEFTCENGLQTASNKLCRHKIAERFKNELDIIYNNISSVKYEDASLSIDEMMEKVTGNKSNQSKNGNFIERGGDSLSAINLIRLLQEKFQVEVPIDFLYNSDTNSPQKLAELIAQEKLHSSPTNREKLNQQIEQDTMLPPDLLPKEGDISIIPTNIFLTGANGFIGMYLLFELLKKFPPPIKIYCLLRSLNKEKFLHFLHNATTFELSDDDKNRVFCCSR